MDELLTVKNATVTFAKIRNTPSNNDILSWMNDSYQEF